jgi:hypothetical protein
MMRRNAIAHLLLALFVASCASLLPRIQPAAIASLADVASGKSPSPAPSSSPTPLATASARPTPTPFAQSWNYPASVTVNTPDLSQPLSGYVNLSVTANDPQYFPAVWPLTIDGEVQGTWWSDTPYLGGKHQVTMQVGFDTTRFSNGQHELYVAVHSNFYDPAKMPLAVTWFNWRGGYLAHVDFENGHALMDVAANYQHVYLRPGQQLALSCRQLFTDGTSGACTAPTWSSDNAAVSVDSNGVLLAGASEGFADVTLADSGKSSTVRVWVRNSSEVPHFESLFVIAPFTLQPSDLRNNPSLEAAVKAAGINSLSRGIYLPVYNVDYDLRQWMRAYDSKIAPDWTWAATNGTRRQPSSQCKSSSLAGRIAGGRCQRAQHGGEGRLGRLDRLPG